MNVASDVFTRVYSLFGEAQNKSTILFNENFSGGQSWVKYIKAIQSIHTCGKSIAPL